MKILVEGVQNRDLVDRLQQFALSHPEQKIEVTLTSSREESLREVEDAEILFPNFDRELFLKSRKLKWVQTFSAGVDMFLFPEFVESEVVLTSGKGFVGIPLAEHAFGLLLALTRGIAPAAHHRKWDGYPYESQELYGKVMGVVGFGGTGREAAVRAHAFGMGVLAIDIVVDVPAPDFIEEIWGLDQLPKLLGESDVVMIGLPLTEETRGLFNRETFRQMKRTAYLINVTRGQIMDMDGLIEALQEGWIAGAGLDVVPEEPLPPDNPLWGMENVVITPHCAGASPVRMERTWDQFLENLSRWINGEPMLGTFNRNQGF